MSPLVANGDFAVQPYIVMEQIAGPTLAREPLPHSRHPPGPRLGAEMAAALDLDQQYVLHLEISWRTSCSAPAAPPC